MTDAPQIFPPGHGDVTFTTKRERAVRIRHILPADARLLVDLYNQLSPETRRLRFFVAKADIPGGVIPPEAEQFAHLKAPAEVALIATVVEEQQERAVGLGQLEPIQNDPTAAEVAIVLRDDYQGEGLGKARFDLLLQVALVRGLKRIVAITLAENEMMYLLAREAGFPVTSETHQGETTVMIGLSDT